MTNDTLTPRQQQVLEQIREHIRRTGYPPTRTELCQALGFRSPNAAESHLRALARKGAIELRPGTSRGIHLPAPADAPEQDGDGLPVVGRVAAGSPILAESHIDRHYRVDAGLFSPRPDYLLRVRGMSMRDAGILDGDLLVVHRTHEARNGQIVVVRLHDEVTVKRLEQQGSQLRLLSENPDYPPIEVDLTRDDASLEGIAVGVIRTEGLS
ncbi:SOS-response transcriptional repressor LexA [Alkalispirillum mobile]|uniref:LexA repressor n=1 Tax=Alkalispirillum mobile TaxID=85925 RepID=A0A498C0H3_9GAMM|nr:transcriptional repressor LexA [Alkalispirillum mobile]RLK48833.1 SOS-response transcriptional repressor LexA [Alkalispirillum mobile]